jgi:hypothetical protein
MYNASITHLDSNRRELHQRLHERLTMRCPARVRIGNRQYAGYLENISEAGAKLRTLSPIIDCGKVIVQLPDLPPLHGELRWADVLQGGVAFTFLDQSRALREWIRDRTSKQASVA